MQIKPVKEYKDPKYPKRDSVMKRPELLLNLPERWRNNTFIAAAIASLLFMTLTACSSKDLGRKAAGGTLRGQASPIFIHGDGRGTFGCESVAPPAFLSEEEAFTVIAEEAKREGIILKKDSPTLRNVRIPKTDTFYDPDKKENTGSQNGSLLLDGYDESKKIAFEFVSKDDIYSWKGKDEGRGSSVESFEFLQAAEILAKGIKDKTGDVTVATFYDPHYKYDSESIQKIIKDSKDDYAGMEEKMREQVKSDLKEQVRDFLSWLKGQGII